MGWKLLPELWPPNVDLGLWKPLAAFGGAIILSQLPELVLTNAERLVLTYFSVASLGYYSIAYTYANVGAVVTIAISQVVYPMFTRLQSSEKNGELDSLFRRAVTVMWLVLAPLAVVLAVAAHPVLTAWLGESYGRKSTPACYILLVGLVFNGIAAVSAWLCFASGRAGLVARYRWFEVVPYLVVAPLLVAKFGIVGAAAAWTVRTVVDSAILYVSVQRRQRSAGFPQTLAFGNAKVMGVLLPPVVLLFLKPTQWFWIPLVSSVCLAVYVILVWRVVLTDAERDWVLTASQRVRLRRAI
jgi:O-antigen/teichoic acid export membrane protein